jgi:hypothetical protein
MAKLSGASSESVENAGVPGGIEWCLARSGCEGRRGYHQEHGSGDRMQRRRLEVTGTGLYAAVFCGGIYVSTVGAPLRKLELKRPQGHVIVHTWALLRRRIRWGVFRSSGEPESRRREK